MLTWFVATSTCVHCTTTDFDACHWLKHVETARNGLVGLSRMTNVWTRSAKTGEPSCAICIAGNPPQHRSWQNQVCISFLTLSYHVFLYVMFP